MAKQAPFTRGVPTDNWGTPYNAFNSMKYLMWRDHIEHILKGNFLPPYMVDIDISNKCNFNCIWCNSKGIRKQSPTMLSQEHLVKLADFLKEWGVKSACIAGGGEPLFNPAFPWFLDRMHNNGLKTGIITNGSLMGHYDAVAILRSSWCGFSIDAGTKETYSQVHHVKPEIFNKTIENLKHLVELKQKHNSKVEITYKYLLYPWNAHEILKAVKLARDIGCDTFHLRPVCVDNLYNQKQEPIKYTKPLLEKINKDISIAKTFEDKDFKFFGIRHKFNPDFSRKINFKHCLATPMMTTFGADGNVHLCFDCRGRKDWILCRHIPDPSEILKVWGSEQHKKIIDGIDPNSCPRCTFGPLNEIIEQVFIDDKMYKDFL